MIKINAAARTKFEILLVQDNQGTLFDTACLAHRRRVPHDFRGVSALREFVRESIEPEGLRTCAVIVSFGDSRSDGISIDREPDNSSGFLSA